jgi:malonyl-CoA decarboxylase
LGNFLIKNAAQHLLAELPQLQHLVTLSPIPGFKTWLITKLQAAAAAGSSTAMTSSNGSLASSDISQEQQLLRAHEADLVTQVYAQLVQQQQQQQQQQTDGGSENSTSAGSSSSRGSTAAASALLQLVQCDAWLQLPDQQQQALQAVLLRLCAQYLLREKRRGWALDPVQHFHLKNGAWLWRINTR